jgi:hypothetical protein
MKKTKKAFKSSICGGHKGKVVIQKTNLSRRKAQASNVVAARAVRAALKGKTRQSSPTSTTPSPTVTIVSSVCTNGTQSTSGMSSLTQESTKYKKCEKAQVSYLSKARRRDSAVQADTLLLR